MAFPALSANRRERASDATRARLYEAAIAEFRSAGFEQASVARIAEAAGVSRPSFYFHFPTKSQVLVELEYAIERDLAERLKRGRSLSEAFEILVEGLVEAERSVGSEELFREMLIVAIRRTPGSSFDPTDFPALLELARHFEQGAARGELRAGIDPKRAPLLCLASAHGIQVGVEPDQRAADYQHLFSLYLAEEQL